MKNTKLQKYYPWIVVALLWVVALLNYMDRQMLSTMRESMQVDIAELEEAVNFGRLMAIFLWIYGLVSPVAGAVADRISRKWLIVGSLGVWSAVTLLMGLFDLVRADLLAAGPDGHQRGALHSGQPFADR